MLLIAVDHMQILSKLGFNPSRIVELVARNTEISIELWLTCRRKTSANDSSREPLNPSIIRNPCYQAMPSPLAVTQHLKSPIILSTSATSRIKFERE